MAIVYTQQYNPVSDVETESQYPCSYRWARDTGDNLNNLKAHVACTRIRGQFFAGALSTPESNTAEVCLAILAPVFIPTGYNRISWTCCYNHLSGSNSVTLRAYSMTGLWRDSPVMNTAKIIGEYHVSSATSESGGAWNIATARDLEIARDGKGRTWVVLTGQNADSSTRLSVATLDAWAYLSV